MKNIKLFAFVISVLAVMAIFSACANTPSGGNPVTRQPANPAAETQSAETQTPDTQTTDTQSAETKISDTQAIANQPEQGQLIGGDRDEHGCLGPAGYSWCEVKQKCLRVWEEECVSSEESGIKAAFAKKYEKPVSDITLRAVQIDNDFARGGVSLTLDGQGEGGTFLAVKKNEEWTLVFDGNGSVDCKAIKEYGFPAAMLYGFCD